MSAPWDEAGSDADAAPEAPPRQPLSPAATLRVAILLYIVETIGYGLPMLVWPQLLWEDIAGASGDALDGLVATRWAGGVLVGLGVGALMVLLKPAGQRTFVSAMAIHTSLAGAAVVYSMLSDELDVVDAWFRWVSLLLLAGLAGFLWLARWRAKGILKMN